MKSIAAIILVLATGCAHTKLPPRPVPSDTEARTIAIESAKTFEGSLRRFLGPSRYLWLEPHGERSDGAYDYAAFRAAWGIESGFEGVYHSAVIFVKKRTEADWSAARIFIDPRSFSSPFEGPLSLLEEKGDEFGRPKPYPTASGPDLLVIPGTHP